MALGRGLDFKIMVSGRLLACPKLVFPRGLKEMFVSLWEMRGAFAIFVVVPVKGQALPATGFRWILGEG